MSLKHLFWDSCIFIRYLTSDDSSGQLDDISRFIDEARVGIRTVYYSTLTIAEIQQDHFKGAGFGTLKEFFEDIGSNFIGIEPNPNIMLMAGELRSAKSTNPGKPGAERSRVISTPDAIMLTTCLFAKDQLGIADIVMHSTDEGKHKGPEGRCVPIVGFEKWYPEATRTPLVSQVCTLRRERPSHPEPTLAGIVVRGNFPNRGGQGGPA